MSFIKVERAKRGLRQSDLAELTGISGSKIFRAEKSNNILEFFSYKELERLASGLNMTIDEMITLYREEYL